MKYRITCTLLLLLLLVLHSSFYIGYVACNMAFCGVATLLVSVSVFQHACFNSKTTFAIAAYVVWLLMGMALKGSEFHTDRGYLFCICWLLFFTMQSMFADHTIRGIMIWIFVVCAGLEMVIGFGQLFGLLGNGDSLFTLGGSFSNPAMFAAYLSLVMPFVLAEYLCIRKNPDYETKQYVLLGGLILGAYFIAISYSRGAWIASAISIGYVVGKYVHAKEKTNQILATQGRKIAAATVCAMLVVGMAAALYSIKKDSADGRLFIWKVAVMQPHQNIVSGDGIGAFEANYGRWQRDYFSNNGGTECERYLADYVTCAYNEFLETYIEQGIVGLLLLMAILIAALRFKPRRESHVFIATKAALMGFMVLCCVSYPTHYEVLYLQFTTILALLYSHQEPYERHNTIGVPTQLILLICVAIFGLIPLWQGYSRCAVGRKKVMLGDIRGALNLYESAYPTLYNNGTFLFYYGSALRISGDKQKSILILERARHKSSDTNIPLLLGDAYKESGDTAKALAAYQDAINCIPSRLYPRYQKARLLMEAGYKDEAYRLADEILLAKEKTPTTAGKEIKEEMRKMIGIKKNVDLK